MFEEEITRDVVEMEREQPTWFLWNETVYACVADKFTREALITDDGNPITIDLSLRVRVDLFPDHNFPRSGQKVHFPVDGTGGTLPDTTEYRVRRTRSKQLSVLWVDCVDLNV